jgi:hypothetical protein
MRFPMRTLLIDQFEFPEPGTEESLEIRIAQRSDFPFPGVTEFVASVADPDLAAGLPRPLPFSTVPGSTDYAEYLHRFAGVEASGDRDWDCYVLPSGEDERWLVLDAGNFFVSYKWATSA